MREETANKRNGEWKEEKKSLQFSCAKVELNAGERGFLEGSFLIREREGRSIEGYIFVKDLRMECLTPKFSGEETEIFYRFDGRDLEPGEKISGSFGVVSDGGEYSLPFEVCLEREVLNSSMGEIRNLFHFTNLAKTNWEEAAALFFHKDFPKILKGADGHFLDLYRGLASRKKEQNVEEFLLAIHKKKKMTYQLSEEAFIFPAKEELWQEKIEITRSGWGYTKLRVKTEGTFLSVEKSTLREEDFLGNLCELPLVIHPEKLHAGNNWGRVTLYYAYGSLQAEILVKKKGTVPKERRQRQDLKLAYAQLTSLYLEFRCRKTAADKWKRETTEVLEELRRSQERSTVFKLFMAHLYITEERKAEAKWLLDRAEKEISNRGNRTLYAYYLYLTTLWNEDEEYVSQVALAVEELFYREDDNWRIAWLLLYLSRELRMRTDKKWKFLEQMFQKGCTSPVLYLEAMLLLNYQPTLLMQLGEIEIRILRFGQSHGILSKEVKGVLQYLSLREKEFSYPLFSLLRSICEEGEEPELLQALCSLLIKGNKTGKEYFPWYEKAVVENLRITRLYEYYMMSLDKEKHTDIPKIVLMYFSYQCNLGAEDTAYLYHYVYENRREMQDLYLAYAPAMERFVVKQLHSGRVNRDLGYLYEHMIASEMMTPDNAGRLAELMFLHEITTKEKNLERVAVIHPRLKEEITCPFVGGKAKLPLYGGDYTLLFEDKWGNRFAPEERYPVREYLPVDILAKEVRPFVREHLGLDLFFCGDSREGVTVTGKNEESYLYLSLCEEITESFRQTIRGQLMNYYYEEDRMDLLDGFLEECLPDSVEKNERKSLVRYLSARGMHEKAYRFLQIYGPEQMEPKLLVRVLGRILEQTETEEEAAMTWLSYAAFQKGKYSENILQYLAEHFCGTTKEMRDIYRAAVDFELDVYHISERILNQLLFSGAFIAEEAQVFGSYVAGGGKTGLEVAFLTHSAREYLIEGRVIDGQLVREMARVYRRGGDLPFMGKLAYLKYFSEHKEERTEEEKKVLHSFLREMVLEQQIYLPFLQEYGREPGMEALSDRTIVSYKTDTDKRVMLHYRMGNEGENGGFYRKEPMEEMLAGIYVRDFVLFYGEELQYYITEVQENKEELTESGTLQREEQLEEKKEGRYQMLNDMAIGKTLQDYDTVDSLLEEYWKKDFVTDNVFRVW